MENESDRDMIQSFVARGNYHAAINIAIGFEKESVLFLHEMLELVGESDKKAIQKLLDEERDHVKRLSVLKAQIG